MHTFLIPVNSLSHPKFCLKENLLLMPIRLGNGVLFSSALVLLDFWQHLVVSYETCCPLGFYDCSFVV